MPSRLRAKPSQVGTPAATRMLTRSQAKQLAPEAAATSRAAAPGSSYEPSPSMSRNKKTCRPPARGLTLPRTKEERCARKSCLSNCGSPSSGSDKRWSTRIKRASCYKEGENDGGCASMQSTGSHSFLRHQEVSGTTMRNFRQSECPPTPCNNQKNKEAASFGLSSRKRRFEKSADIESCGDKYVATRASKVRRCLFKSTPTSPPVRHASSQAQTPPDSNTQETSQGRTRPEKINTNSASRRRATSQTGEVAIPRKRKDSKKATMTEPEDKICSPSEPKDEGAKSCPGGHWMTMDYGCVIL
ncbi:hypothetical protein HPB50_012652 [Hyalomma asiaticum]|uniref:Uncharacterized protein n=1 Tax=Hyalomma asiaticum TaxID=266040 RepID=A0ACB7TGW3_HYAAI|nr:hypothetical protein HPB50_028301 [Hyalomma asiaticum]KAH6946280.1 hypothetical protein HPB50_012652 [Hyalomma asiaticum]